MHVSYIYNVMSDIENKVCVSSVPLQRHSKDFRYIATYGKRMFVCELFQNIKHIEIYIYQRDAL